MQGGRGACVMMDEINYARSVGYRLTVIRQAREFQVDIFYECRNDGARQFR